MGINTDQTDDGGLLPDRGHQQAAPIYGHTSARPDSLASDDGIATADSSLPSGIKISAR